MKYVVFLGDGMADTPVEALQGKTPLMVANKPNIDALAPYSEVGLAKTVPDGMKPGSDTANLAVMGYDPRSCYSGRSPLEALSMGLTLEETDIAVRCNLVTLSSEEENYADKRMLDYSAGEITSAESKELIEYLQEHLGNERLSFHPGISYRHCLIVHDATVGSELTPPHDITGKLIKRHLPAGLLGELFLDLQMKSYELLKDHPVNLKRIEEGKNPANSIWLWGEGTKPAIPDFYEKNGVKGAVISAVDLLKGIGKGAGMEVIEVEGATGGIVTDFAAKGRAAIDALGRVDYVYIHVEAPDESGHQGLLDAKINAIEKIDADIVGPVVEYLKGCGEAYHVLVCPDHPTPLATRTHSAAPIPFLIYKSDLERSDGPQSYDEETAAATGVFVEEGFTLIDRLLSSEEPIRAEGITPSVITTAEGEEIVLTDPENAESAEGTEGAQTDGETSDDATTETENAEGEEKEKKEKKPNKFAIFFKKHLLAFIIAIAVLLIAAGLTVGHFVGTYHLSFIRDGEDLANAVAKEQITRIVLKKDVTYSGDLILPRTVDIDLNEYTLTVEGDLKLPLEEDAKVGYRKKGDYVFGGKIIAKNIFVAGTKSFTCYADLQAESIAITASKIYYDGSIDGEANVTSLSAAEIAFNGKAAGTISLADGSTMTLCGEVNRIEKGSTLTVKSGRVGTVTETDVLYVYEDAKVSAIINVGDYYRVTRLAPPKEIIVLEENGDFRCYLSEVIGATHFAYSLNGVEKDPVPVTAGTTVITLNSDDLTPGKQTIVVKATAQNDARYLPSDEKSYTFEFSAKLDTPTPTVTEEEGNLILKISEVKHADKYVYTIDGTRYETTTLSTDVTDKIVEGGVHVIEVTATSDNKYFSDSNVAMTSYVKYLTLTTPIPTAEKGEETVRFTWAPSEGATSYLVTYGTDVVYTTETTLDLPSAEGDFTIKAIGGGHYLDSPAATLTAAEIDAPTPPADPSDPEDQ